MSQYPGYLSYSMSNNYHPLVDAETFQLANSTMYRQFGCLDRVRTSRARYGQFLILLKDQ